ncbi:S2-RNase [Pyrus ussuriensis x Pyrus communis]|uniref:S2-RNase n=1 Tax=Pyrus ussuriensis x Pyrus communis TaxID=2448454 RepID=A0A5N5HJ10_9ROSA|nr:S2-RNase [Pyrus ussuriensis x Pyrus communis]
MSLVVDLRNHPLFSVPSLKSSWRCSPYPSILCCLSVFITVLLRLRKPNPYPTSLLIQPQTSILFHLVHLPLLSTYRPSHNLFSKSCCGFAPSEGVLGAPIGPSSSFLFRFLVLLAGVCVRGSDLLALLRC